MMQFEEFSNVHNSDRASNAIRLNLAYKLNKNNARSRLFCRIAKRSIHLFGTEDWGLIQFSYFFGVLKTLTARLMDQTNEMPETDT